MKITPYPATNTFGLTLFEILISITVLAASILVILGVPTAQLTLVEHGRYLNSAMNDVSRVVDQMRRQNTAAACTTPSLTVPGGFASWDAWLTDTNTGGGGKSIQPNPAVNELIVVGVSGTNPLAVTVAACWRHRSRTIGECSWNGTALTPNPAAGGSATITESPAMISTRITCRNT